MFVSGCVCIVFVSCLYRVCSMRVRMCIAFVSHLYRSCAHACVCVCLCYTGCLTPLYPQRWIVSATQEDVRGNMLPGGSCFVFGAYSAAFSSVQSGSTVTGHGKRGKTIDGVYVGVCVVCVEGLMGVLLFDVLVCGFFAEFECSCLCVCCDVLLFLSSMSFLAWFCFGLLLVLVLPCVLVSVSVFFLFLSLLAFVFMSGVVL